MKTEIRHLVMFDLDGTLLQSNTLDVRCFSAALKEVLGVERVNGDWTAFKYVTDAGIVAEIAAAKLQRAAKREEMAALKAAVLAQLEARTSDSREEFAPIPGALELLEALEHVEGCALAIATGCWRESARLKMAAAGFDTVRFPMGSCDDSHRREEIMRAAYRRAAGRFAPGGFETVTYIGDGVWDLRASRSLGYRFIGIGFYDTQGTLRREGAGCVFRDFVDRAAFLAELAAIWRG